MNVWIFALVATAAAVGIVMLSGDAPRIRHCGSSQPTGEPADGGGTVVFERGFDPEVIRELLSRGHRLGKDDGGFGGFQGIWWDR